MDYNEFGHTPEPSEPLHTDGGSGFHTPENMDVPNFMPHTQSQERIYRGEGVGRKETVGGASPFTNPPYEQFVPPAQEPPREPPHNDNPQPWSYPEPEMVTKPEPVTPAPEKSGSKRWVNILISAGVAAAAAVVVCLLMTASLNRSWRERTEQLTQSYEEQLNKTKKELQDAIAKNKGNNQRPSTSTPDTTEPAPGTQENQTPVQPSTGSTGDLTPAQVYAQCVNSVVAINGTGNAGSSSGSGFILSEDGFVVTNFHVVEGQSKLEVMTYDGLSYDAEYIGGNEANDIALIKMDAENLPPVTVGVSADLVVGEQVAAIGNPLGELASTLTVGYISAKDRMVATDGTTINMLQTDAAINPGNSGGPLFNMRGEVIGITSAKYSGTTNSGATIEGIGFAIPMDDVLGMLNDLREYGYITGGYLGISASDVDQQASELYGLPSGVLVRDVTEGSCAEKAGMKVQDIIINLGGHEVKNLNDLSRALNKFEAGETVEVTVYRSGEEKVLSVVLDERPKDLSDASTNTVPEATEPDFGGDLDDFFDFFLP